MKARNTTICHTGMMETSSCSSAGYDKMLSWLLVTENNVKSDNDVISISELSLVQLLIQRNWLYTIPLYSYPQQHAIPYPQQLYTTVHTVSLCGCDYSFFILR